MRCQRTNKALMMWIAMMEGMARTTQRTSTSSITASAFVAPARRHVITPQVIRQCLIEQEKEMTTAREGVVMMMSEQEEQQQLEKNALVLKEETKEMKDIEEEVEMEDDDDDDEAFLADCEALCQERNLSLEKVKNARDLASVVMYKKDNNNAPLTIQPNRIYRTGKLSDATAADIDLLMNQLQIKTIVDLRSPTELKDDETLQTNPIFEGFTNLVWFERGLGRPGKLKELDPQEPIVKKRKRRIRRFWKKNKANDKQKQPDEEIMEEELVVEEDCGFSQDDDDKEDDDDDEEMTATSQTSRKERHFVSLMNEFKYVRGTLSKVRKRDIARTVLKSPGALVSQRVKNSVKKPFLDKINHGGLPMLYELLLRFGAPGIKYVLELCADRSRHPIVFHCTAGKDRTGIISVLLLSLLEHVSNEDIVQDYSMSANVYAQMNDHKAMVGALSQRSLNPKTFLGAPPQAMWETLEVIREEYGSVEGYLDWIGFGPEKREKLKQALTEK